MFLALPYYSCSSAKSIHSCFLYTTQGDAEDAELQESVCTNDTQGCYIAGVHDTAQKKQFPSPNTLTGILPSSDNLDSNNETELTCLAHGTFLSLLIWEKGPGLSSTSPLNAITRWATHSICTQENLQTMFISINTGNWLFVFSGSCLYKKQPQPLLFWAAIFLTEVRSLLSSWSMLMITYSTKFIT